MRNPYLPHECPSFDQQRAQAASTMLAALKTIRADNDGGWYREHPTARLLDAAIAQAEAAGI